MKRVAVVLVVVSLPVTAPLTAYLALGLVSFLQGANLTPEDPSLRTEYVFLFDTGKEVRIRDEYSRIIRAWGGRPDFISIDNSARTVRFSESAILKTSVDSIEPHATHVKVKGHLGIWTQDTEFTVDQEGIIRGTKWVN